MAAQGTGFDTPRACPFVALELDRDRRSDSPDYRHRCFAEPTPAPRSIAHQEAYCLSPNFSACPVFQDWAVRAAARPVAPGGSGAATVSGAAVVGGAAAAGGLGTDTTWSASAASAPDPAASPAPDTAADEEPALADLPEDASVTPAGAVIAAAAAASTGIASPPTFATTWEDDARESEQLAVFGAPTADAQSSYGEPDAGYPEPAASPAFVPPPAQPQQQSQAASEPADSRDAAAAATVPGFLAGRAARPANPSAETAPANPPARPPTPAPRDEIVPSWDIDGRYGAEGPVDPGPGGNKLDGILTAIAVVAILALGVAAVLFLPGLLSKGKPAATQQPSIAIVSPGPSALPSAIASLAPTAAASVAPTTAATAPASQGPVASARTYTIKSGDSLARVAKKFGITVQDILDANPGITDANSIFVGQIIVIPGAATP